MSKTGKLCTGGMVLLIAVMACGTSSKNTTEDANARMGPTCDQDAAKGFLTFMSDPRMAKVTEQNGRVIVRFGKDYSKLTPTHRQTLTENFVKADSCLHKQMRVIEFQDPSGEVVVQTDGLVQTQM